MSESLEELKAIIDNAPEGAVSVFNGIYLDNKRNFWYDGWFGIHEYIEVKQPVRSLSDIKRIIELMELNQNMHITVAGYIYGKDWEHWNEFNAGRFRL